MMVDDYRWMNRMDGVDEKVIVGVSSKTVVKGKQNNTGLGGTMKNGDIYDAQSQDRRNWVFTVSGTD